LLSSLLVRIEAIVLRTVNAQPTLWEAILPEAVLGLPVELEAVDGLLDDQRFFAPYRAFFHATLGRPSVPMETYLRLMFLKYRYQLGFEPLCREVSDSISWQRFCRIPLGSRVPHPTTLMKITSRCGERAVAELNDALIAKAAERRLIKMHKLRADTTLDRIPPWATPVTLPGVTLTVTATEGYAVTEIRMAGSGPQAPTATQRGA
jgi:transposase, IS5 family